MFNVFNITFLYFWNTIEMVIVIWYGIKVKSKSFRVSVLMTSFSSLSLYICIYLPIYFRSPLCSIVNSTSSNNLCSTTNLSQFECWKSATFVAFNLSHSFAHVRYFILFYFLLLLSSSALRCSTWSFAFVSKHENT